MPQAECFVCKLCYHQPFHVPRLLPCGHSFCEFCLKQLQTSSAASSGGHSFCEFCLMHLQTSSAASSGTVIFCPKCSHLTQISASVQSLPMDTELFGLTPRVNRKPGTHAPTRPATMDAALDGLVEVKLQQRASGDRPSISERLSFRRSFIKSELRAGGTLHAGDSLISTGEEYTFINQDDGNLVIYTKQGQPTWASGTGQGSLTRGDLKLLRDGNLILVDTERGSKPVWASMSQGLSRAAGPYRLIMQDDGNLVIYGANSVATWATLTLDGTSGHFTMVAGQHEMTSTVTWLPTCDKLVARNGKYSLVNQGDGNLCVYNEAGAAIWSSGTLNKGVGNLYMQRDGNLVLYSTDGDIANPDAQIWASGTARRGAGPFKLVMQDDGNLVIYDSNSNATWASRAGALWRSFIKSELCAGETLHAGDSLISTGENYTFINQDDGNLVIYTKQRQPTWASGTGPGSLTQGDFQLLRDGNLILVDTERGCKPVWASMSQGPRAAGPYRLIMQDDGNLVIYGKNAVPTWASWSDSSSGHFTMVAGQPEMTSTVTWLPTCDKLVSRNGKYSLVNQEDGNLCVYNEAGAAIWSSGTLNKGAGNLYMQRDGNLVLYNTHGVIANPGASIWASGTARRGAGPFKVVMQDDGNLVIYDSNSNATWASRAGALWRSFIKSELRAGETLHAGDSLISTGENYTFINQDDGNLVIYTKQGQPTWASGTWAESLTRRDFQLLRDGNLILVNTERGSEPVWASMSQGPRATGPYRLIMQDDGNLVIYGENDVPTWASWSDSSSGLFTMVAGQPEMTSAVTWLPTCDKLVASNGKYSLVNQGDGNLCVYNEAGAAIWSSRTLNKGVGNLYMQRDGNLVLYNTDGDIANPGAPIWASRTARRGVGPFKLVMQDDGNLIIYDSNSNATWASRGRVCVRGNRKCFPNMRRFFCL